MAIQLAEFIKNNPSRQDNNHTNIEKGNLELLIGSKNFSSWKGGRLHSTVMYRLEGRLEPLIVPVIDETLVLLVGYDNHCTKKHESNDNILLESESESELIGRILPQAFDSVLHKQDKQYQRIFNATVIESVSNPKEVTDTKENSGFTESRIVSMTQSTAAKMRHSALTQESQCAAVGDVIVITYQKFLFPDLENQKNEAIGNNANINANFGVTTPSDSDSSLSFLEFPNFIRAVNEDLQKQWNSVRNQYDSFTDDLNSLPPRILAVQSSDLDQNLKSSSSHLRLHAERSCTQRIYHYLLPLSWLPDGELAEEWCLGIVKSSVNIDQKNHNNEMSVKEDTNESKSISINSAIQTHKSIWKAHHKRHVTPPPPSLKNLKHLLKSAESQRFSSLPSTFISSSSSSSSSSPTANDEFEPKVQTRHLNPNPNIKVASGRFGALANRERRCWHNFADPALMGNASPSNEPVWRSLDRARSGQFLIFNSTDRSENYANINTQNSRNHETLQKDSKMEAIAVIEFRGDGFVKQQIRRIIGSVIAMAHGWLPKDFLEIATRPDVVVETPLAPANRMYFAEARFHFDELRKNGRSMEKGGTLFESAMFLTDEDHDWTEDILDVLLSRCSQEEHRSEEEDWLVELRDVIAPRIREQLSRLTEDEKLRNRFQREPNDSRIKEELHENDEEISQHKNVLGYDIKLQSKIRAPIHTQTPNEYKLVLKLLRAIIESGRWPVTSVARSKVIRSNSNDESDRTNVRKSGSFTIVNPKFFEISPLTGDPPKISFPKSNELFPDLVKAVFELEAELATQIFSNGASDGIRPSSSHCAINCNAEFTPHVDSGRGKGQSLSMIVGLGDYNGGELRVEESTNSVRYEPLQFDGWKQRHWTMPFEGERFSLVWFTPEL